MSSYRKELLAALVLRAARKKAGEKVIYAKVAITLFHSTMIRFPVISTRHVQYALINLIYLGD